MPNFALSIRTKLAILSTIGIILVAGMLAGQQIGDRSASRERTIANNRQTAAVEALRASSDIGDMRMAIREMRLAIASSDVDRAMEALSRAAAAAESRIDTALGITDDASDKDSLESLSKLVKNFVAVSTELAAAAREYGDTQAKVQEANKLGDQMNALVDLATDNLVATASARNAEASDLQIRLGRMNLGIGLFVMAVLGVVAVFGSLVIGKPIRRVGEVLLELARGTSDVDVPYTARTDEVGDNARAAQAFKQKLILIEQLENAKTEAARQNAEQRRSDVNNLAGRFEGTVASVVRSVSSSSTELEAAAEALNAMAGATRDLSGKVLSASAQAADSVQSVSLSTDKLMASIDEISRQVQKSTAVARQAVTQAEKTDSRITELTRAAERITDVVRVIAAIAEQTNLLALNATIEAARAGESGKGFAVVAQEVKALAAQTSKATSEIGSQIAGVQAATQDSVGSIKEIGATINRIDEIAAEITAAVEQQVVSTRDIADNVEAAKLSAAHVTTNIAEVNESASGISDASTQILSSAKSLSREGNLLTVEMEKLLSAVRVA